jgi:hypothetical protein
LRFGNWYRPALPPLETSHIQLVTMKKENVLIIIAEAFNIKDVQNISYEQSLKDIDDIWLYPDDVAISALGDILISSIREIPINLSLLYQLIDYMDVSSGGDNLIGAAKMSTVSQLSSDQTRAIGAWLDYVEKNCDLGIRSHQWSSVKNFWLKNGRQHD